MSITLDQILDAYNVGTLNSMVTAATLLPAKGKKPNKSQLVALMKEKYFTAERVRATLAKLTTREKAVLNRLLLRGGESATKALKRETLRAKLTTEAPSSATHVGSLSNEQSTIFEDVIARLTLHGLVFSKPVAMDAGYNYKFQFDPGDQLIIPAIVRQFLPPADPLPAETAAWQPGHTEHSDPMRLLRELYLYWDFARRNEVQILQNGLVGKRSLKALNQMLLVPDPLVDQASGEDGTEKLQTMRALLEGLGLVQAVQGRLVAPKKGKELIPEFWSKDEVQQLTACSQVWLALPNGNEVDSKMSVFRPDYGQARRSLLRTLKQLSPDVWHEMDELLTNLQESEQNFLFPDRNKVESQQGRSYYYYSYGYYSGSPADIIKKFDNAEKHFLEQALVGFLFQCGLVELGYTQADQQHCQAIRLTKLGLTVLARLDKVLAKTSQPATQIRLAEPPAPAYNTPAKQPVNEIPPLDSPSTTPDQGRIVVQPNFQILAIGPVKLNLLAQLDLVAERRKADIGVFEYHLSRDSVYNAQQAGMPVDEIKYFLQESNGAALPQNVLRTLDEWGAHHERIIFRTGVNLLQAADEATLQALLENSAVGAHLARALAPGVALVKGQRTDKLIKGLLQSNLLPAISNDQPTSADHSVVINKAGSIKPIHSVPSLHLSGRLARFAEKQADGLWQITPSSIRRAGGDRKKVLDLLEEMRKLQRGTLPSVIGEQVKKWGAYFGDASVETVTLVEFRDQQALAELRQIATLQDLLIPFPAGDRALAMIPAARLSEVEQILTDLGANVKAGLAR
jgi:hypothetical protein